MLTRSVWTGWGMAVALGLGSALAPAAWGGAAGKDDRIKTEMVEFKGGDGMARAYLARPEGDGPFPAIIVIQEWWGLADWIKRNADHFAKQGYVALAVDLYDGKVADNPADARKLAMALDKDEAVAKLKGGVDYLKARPYVARGEKMGSVGWCMGGGFSRMLAQAADEIGPTVICYGSVTDDKGQVGKLKDNPVLGIFGADDGGIKPDSVRSFERALKAQGSAADIHIYDGAGHGFMRPGGPSYAEKAADDAWQRIDRFFAENLKKKG